MSQFIEMFGSVDDNLKSYDIKKVGDFAECFAGATPSTKIPSYWDNGNIPWMSSGEVHKGRVQDTDAKITQQGYDGCSTKMVPIHSIVVALAGQGKTRGTIAINEIELCTNQSLCAIVPNEEVNYEYLFHNLRGRYKELRSMSGDVDGRGGLNLKHIQSIKVIVPPMSEQMKFVSIAQQADKSEFDESKSQFIEMFGYFHNKVHIKDVCHVVSGKSIPTKLEDIDGNNPYIKVADFNLPGNEKYITVAQRYVSDDSASYSKQIPKGSVIFAKNGAASMSNKKRLTQIGCCIDMNTMAVFPKNDSIFPVFLFATIEAMDVSSHVRQGAIPSISPKSIEDSYIAMPTMEEQYRYISIAKQADKSESVGQYRIAC